MTTEKIESQAVCRQVFLTHGGHQQRPGIVIGAVAMGSIGDGIVSVLQHAGIIGKGFQMIEFDLRELEISDGLDVFNIGVPGTRGPGAVLAHLTEHLEIFSGYLLPNRFPTEGIGFFTHGMPFDIVVQKPDNLFRQGIRVAKGDNPPPALGKHLGGIPVRRRNDGLARAHGIG